jgi:uncharacterized protein (DUF362 family)/Pyruvate/2-oxoacid:ferredoxin oxidoreductase delta subunit
MSPKDTVSQVALVRCTDYENNAVYDAIHRGLALMGGAGRFVHPGEQILIKPNLLVASSPESAVSPHPTVFRAVARCLQEAGARLTCGDSPGFGPLPFTAWRAGYAAVASEFDIPLADFTNGQTISFPQGRLIKQFVIADGVLAADGLVSLSKLKAHGLTRLTGAVKNQFGCIPGLLKSEFHTRMPDRDRFCQMLVDLNRFLRPRLYIMDGVVAMEGNGPRNGTPRPMSVLLLSADPIALDATACRLVNLDPELVLTNKWGEAWGLGSYSHVELLGDPFADLQVPDFAINRKPMPATGRRGWVGSLAKRWVIPRPVLHPANCTCCGTCVEVCPVDPKAIDFPNHNSGAPPGYDYDRCIRCYCCQELCPHDAIGIETPLLGRLIHR